jgi:hypothetical protein
MRDFAFETACSLAVVLVNLWIWSYIMNAPWFDHTEWYGMPTFMTSIVLTMVMVLGVYVFSNNPIKRKL